MLFVVLTMSHKLTFIWLLATASVLISEAQYCYSPDGSLDLSNTLPCYAGRHSMCCQINKPSPDFCRPDGLCQDSASDQLVWRETCTDRTWQADECL